MFEGLFEEKETIKERVPEKRMFEGLFEEPKAEVNPPEVLPLKEKTPFQKTLFSKIKEAKEVIHYMPEAIDETLGITKTFKEKGLLKSGIDTLYSFGEAIATAPFRFAKGLIGIVSPEKAEEIMPEKVPHPTELLLRAIGKEKWIKTSKPIEIGLSPQMQVKKWIEEGVDPKVAVLITGSQIIFDAAITAGIAEGILRGIAKPPPPESLKAKTAREILGVKKGATLEEIKTAYYKKAHLAHPDKIGGSVEAFNKLNQAYKALTGVKPKIIKIKEIAYSLIKERPWPWQKIAKEAVITPEVPPKPPAIIPSPQEKIIPSILKPEITPEVISKAPKVPELEKALKIAPEAPERAPEEVLPPKGIKPLPIEKIAPELRNLAEIAKRFTNVEEFRDALLKDLPHLGPKLPFASIEEVGKAITKAGFKNLGDFWSKVTGEKIEVPKAEKPKIKPKFTIGDLRSSTYKIKDKYGNEWFKIKGIPDEIFPDLTEARKYILKIRPDLAPTKPLIKEEVPKEKLSLFVSEKQRRKLWREVPWIAKAWEHGIHWSELTKEQQEALKRHTLQGKHGLPPEIEEYLDEGIAIGFSLRRVLPKEIKIEKKFETIPIEIEKEPKDLIGFKGWFKKWIFPVRLIAKMHPIAETIARIGRDTIINLANDQSNYSQRIDEALKGLSKEERAQIADLLDRELSPGEIDTLEPKFKKAYTELRQITKEMRTIAQVELGKAVEKWGISEDAYYPHIFVGSYQILDGEKTIEGGFSKTLEEALDKVKAYLTQNPDAKIRIQPRQFFDEYTATLLSRKGFWRFINEVKKATTLEKEEVLSMMKGIAAIKPRGKFVGNFERRVANLGGFLDDPKIAMKIYVYRILRKMYLDPFRKKASELATKLPPSLRDYFLNYIDDVSGKYDPINKNFVISRVAGFWTSLQSKLKLGFRPVTALVNRFQPMQTAYAEIGNYLFKGYIWKHTAEGKKIIEESGVRGQKPKYYAGEFLSKREVPLWHPLGAFDAAEVANREDVIAGGYLFAKKIFEIPKEEALKKGYGYVLSYLDEFKDPHKAALEYAKDLNVDTNYIYDVSDAPVIFRGLIGRISFQFRLFPVNFTLQTYEWFKEAFIKPTPHNVARAIRFTAMNLLLGGVRTIPYLGIQLWKLLILASLLSFLHPKLKEVFGRGIFTLLGVDLSQRLGPNEFLPRESRDLFGPTGNDLYNIYRYLKGEITWQELLTSPAGVIRDLYRTFKMTEDLEDPYKRYRKITEITGIEKLLKFIGVPLVKETAYRDLRRIINEIEKDYKTKRAKYIDQTLELLEKGKKKEAIELIKKVNKEENLGITYHDLAEERRKKKNPILRQKLKQAPKERKKEIRELLEKAGF